MPLRAYASRRCAGIDRCCSHWPLSLPSLKPVLLLPCLHCVLQNGQPKVAVFHGLQDTLFPIDKTSRPIVQQLAKVLPNSEINYAEGAYAHDAPPAVVKQALEWFLQDKPISPLKFSRKGKAAAAGGPRTAAEQGGRVAAASG